MLYLRWVGEVLYARGLQKCILSAATKYIREVHVQSCGPLYARSPLSWLPVLDAFAAHSTEGRTFTRGTSTFARARADTTKISSTATVVRHRPAAAPRRALRNVRGCGCRTPHHPTVARAGSRRGARACWRRRVAHPTVTGDRGVRQWWPTHGLRVLWAGAGVATSQTKSCRQAGRTRGRHRTGAPRPSGGAPSASQWAVPSGGGPGYVGAAIHGQVCSARREGPDT